MQSPTKLEKCSTGVSGRLSCLESEVTAAHLSKAKCVPSCSVCSPANLLFLCIFPCFSFRIHLISHTNFLHCCYLLSIQKVHMQIIFSQNPDFIFSCIYFVHIFNLKPSRCSFHSSIPQHLRSRIYHKASCLEVSIQESTSNDKRRLTWLQIFFTSPVI